jgi:hypothetical protein
MISYLYGKIQIFISNRSDFIKQGVKFGFVIWLIDGFAKGCLFFIVSPIPFLVVLSLWLSTFFGIMIGGIVISAIYGVTKDEEKAEGS